tara:strand:+ start:104 stop:559 length:456 start_codon:yes stop_codon:yes gene_type:complete
MSQVKRRYNPNWNTYRSGLEDKLVDSLSKIQKEVRYEELKIEWEDLRYRTYTPDFLLDNGIIIEAKGQFDSDDRHKHKCVRRQHPELDIRFVFSNAKAKLYKGSKSTYSDWCNKNKFLWSNKTIPDAWLNEPGKCTTKRLIQLKQKRKKQI